MKRWALIAAGILSLGPSFASAIDFGFAKEDGGQAGSFLDYAASARSLGMGRAHTGIADDASATYWNPAGLAQIERRDLVTLYSDLYEGSGFGFLSYAQPTADAGTFGLSLVSLRSGNYDGRNGTGETTGSFDTSDTGLLFSYGTNLDDRWAVGATLKGVREAVQSLSKTSYGADLGVMHRISPKVQAGLVLHNLLAPKIRLDQESDNYPRDVRVGFKFQPHSRWLLASDLTKSENRNIKLNLGSEYKLSELVALRAGLTETDISAGLGLKFGDWSIDYAFAYHDAVGGMNDLGSAHQFGFHVNFGGKTAERAASLRWIKRGEIYLDALRKSMDEMDSPMTDEKRELIEGTKEAIRHQAYQNPRDLYTAQGYVCYLEGQYERSVLALGEALALSKDSATAADATAPAAGANPVEQDPNLIALQSHFDRAKAQMTDEKTREIVDGGIKRVKELYQSGDYKTTVIECRKILSFNPEHVEAAAYLDDAQARLKEPIVREMRIAKAHMANGAYLDAIKSLKEVKELDPENKEADENMNQAIAALEAKAAAAPELKPERSVYGVGPVGTKSRDLYSLGLSLYSQGKLKEAVAAWEQAVKFDGNNILARNAYQRAVAELNEIQ